MMSEDLQPIRYDRLAALLAPIAAYYLAQELGVVVVVATLSGAAYLSWAQSGGGPRLLAATPESLRTVLIGLVIAIPVAVVGTIRHQSHQELIAELQELLRNDPPQYLRKLKGLGRDDEWLSGLRTIDPEAYTVEVAARKAAFAKQEERKAAGRAEREAERAKQREVRERRRAQTAENERREEICDESQRIPAYVTAKDYMRKRLKAPSSADFASMWESTVVSPECGRWMVHSYVDAQNSFGAMLRTEFIAEIEYQGDSKWKLLSLTER